MKKLIILTVLLSFNSAASDNAVTDFDVKGQSEALALITSCGLIANQLAGDLNKVNDKSKEDKAEIRFLENYKEFALSEMDRLSRILAGALFIDREETEKDLHQWANKPHYDLSQSEEFNRGMMVWSVIKESKDYLKELDTSYSTDFKNLRCKELAAEEIK